MGIRITQDNMRRLVEAVEQLQELGQAAQDWLDAKESDPVDREWISDAREQLESVLEDGEGSIHDLYALLPARQRR